MILFLITFKIKLSIQECIVIVDVGNILIAVQSSNCLCLYVFNKEK